MNWFKIKNWFKTNKQLVITMLLILSLLIVLFSTNILKFGWDNNSNEVEKYKLNKKLDSISLQLSNEVNIRKFNSEQIAKFDSSLTYLDNKLNKKDKEIKDLIIKYDKRIKDIYNLSSPDLAKYFTNRYTK